MQEKTYEKFDQATSWLAELSPAQGLILVGGLTIIFWVFIVYCIAQFI